MTIKLPTTEEIERITRECLKYRFPLFEDEHKVKSEKYSLKGDVWIGYSSRGFTFSGRRGTHFDLNIVGNLCLLVSIELESKQRGKGLGWKLYESVHSISKEIGCRAVRTVPSGGFFNSRGEMIKSRRDYLLERNYVPVNETQVEFATN
ncbi:MAG: hypothetical protein AABW89_05375 [Nanoarchaeota archaeon]